MAETADWRTNFKGYARVNISNLELGSIREEDDSNVQRLVRIFEKQCHRYDPDHFVSALVDEHTWNEVLHCTALECSDFSYQSPPLITLPGHTKLKCLNGRHRLLAARQHFAFAPREEQWWGVKLFDSALSNSAKAALTEQANLALKFNDGDIFRYYRTYLKQRDEEGVNRWQAQLTLTKDRNLLQLERSNHGKLIEAFDNLLPYSGIWTGLQLGALNRILPLRCFEEFCSYLERVLAVWKNVLGSDIAPVDLDVKTVQLLELQCPGSCSNDADVVRRLMNDRSLFRALQDQQSRLRILQRLLSTTRILSIRSFIEDTMYIQACQASLMQLVPGRSAIKESFRVGFRNRFSHEAKYFLANYLDLWMHSMRHFAELSDLPCSNPRKDKGHCKAKRAQIVAHRVVELAYRAHVLGFRSRCISELVEQSAEPLELETASTGSPELTCDWVDTYMKARCNRPSPLSLERDQRYMFPEVAYQIHSTPPKKYITTYYVFQDIVKSFWGLDPPAFLSDRNRFQHRVMRDAGQYDSSARPDGQQETGDLIADAQLEKAEKSTQPTRESLPVDKADIDMEEVDDELFDRPDRAEDEAERVRKETAEVAQRHTDIERNRRLDEANHEVQRLKSEGQAQQRLIDSTNERLQSLEQAKEADAQTSKEQISKLMEETRELQVRIDQLLKETEAAYAKFKQQSESTEATHREMETLKLENQKLRERNMSLQQHLETESAKLKQHAEGSNNDLKASADEIQRLTQELDQLRRQLDIHEKRKRASFVFGSASPLTEVSKALPVIASQTNLPSGAPQIPEDVGDDQKRKTVFPGYNSSSQIGQAAQPATEGGQIVAKETTHHIPQPPPRSIDWLRRQENQESQVDEASYIVEMTGHRKRRVAGDVLPAKHQVVSIPEEALDTFDRLSLSKRGKIFVATNVQRRGLVADLSERSCIATQQWTFYCWEQDQKQQFVDEIGRSLKQRTLTLSLLNRASSGNQIQKKNSSVPHCWQALSRSKMQLGLLIVKAQWSPPSSPQSKDEKLLINSSSSAKPSSTIAVQGEVGHHGDRGSSEEL